MFQHTAARRRLIIINKKMIDVDICVSTHSRPKAADNTGMTSIRRDYVSTHSRPKAADNKPKYDLEDL